MFGEIGTVKICQELPQFFIRQIHLRFSVDAAAPGRIAATYRIRDAGQISLRVAEMLPEAAELAEISELLAELLAGLAEPLRLRVC